MSAAVTGAQVLVWTRSLADWARDRPLVEAAAARSGATPLHLPCVSLEAVGAAFPKEARWDAAVVTSANVVAFAGKDGAAALGRVRVVHTHGKKTAEALGGLGLAVTVHAVRTAEELVDIVAKSLPANAKVLVPRADEPAFDAAAPLRAHGHAVDDVVVYRTHAALTKADGAPPTDAEVAAWQATWEGDVCFGSPSAVKAFLARFPKPPRTLAAVCIGPATAAAARGAFAEVRVAAENTVESLLATY